MVTTGPDASLRTSSAGPTTYTLRAITTRSSIEPWTLIPTAPVPSAWAIVGHGAASEQSPVPDPSTYAMSGLVHATTHIATAHLTDRRSSRAARLTYRWRGPRTPRQRLPSSAG